MNLKSENQRREKASPLNPRHGVAGIAGLVAVICIGVGLHGCGAAVDATIRTANANFDRQQAKRTNSIYDESVARYKAMEQRGDPKGMYYMAIVYAASEMLKLDGDALGAKALYEKAIVAGSTDAKVALGKMLVDGAIMPYGITGGALPEIYRDPIRGIELLKSAAAQSCSYTQPLISIGRCRERESSIAAILMVRFRDGHYGVAKDPEQEAFWRDRMNTCEPIIEEINRRTGCDKLF